MKVVRIIIMLALVVGAVIYYLNFREKKEAILANNSANAALAAGNYKEAIEKIAVALEKGKGYKDVEDSANVIAAKAYAGFGRELAEEKQFNSAIEAFEKVSGFSEKVAGEERADFYIGYCYANMEVNRENTSKALKYLEKANKANPKNLEVKRWLKYLSE